MAPPRKKRVSDPPTTTKRAARLDAIADSEKPQESGPRRGITRAQKQALIDNLQLELTERARRLRAQYNLQAQGLRTRVEIRVNRIPTTLRRLKMGDLLAKHLADQQHRLAAATDPPPPLPAKDYPPLARATAPAAASPRKQLLGSQLQGAVASPRMKRLSDRIAREKENAASLRTSPHKMTRTDSATHGLESAKILSPASSNFRVNHPSSTAANAPKTFPPSSRLQASRASSPVKTAPLPLPPPPQGRAANAIGTVEKTRGARSGAVAPAATTSRTTVRKASAPVPARVTKKTTAASKTATATAAVGRVLRHRAA